MFDFPFAYTPPMHLLLTIWNFISCFIYYYFTTSIILYLYGERSSLPRKLLFTFLIGTVLNNAWTYGIYLLGGMADFSPTTYALTTVPNPVFALLYYLLGIKVLGLSSHRSIRLMSHAFLYVSMLKVLAYFIGSTFFPQSGAEYNYFSDAISLLTVCCVNSLIGLTILFMLKRTRFHIDYRDGLVTRSTQRSLLFSLARSCCIYGIVVVPRIFLSGPANWRDAMQLIILLFLFLFGIWHDLYQVSLTLLANKGTYISALTSSLDDFSGLKHDLYNVLQTYGGYIALGDMPRLRSYHENLLTTVVNSGESMRLNKSFEQNPAFVSLLIHKIEQAESLSIQFRAVILCPLDKLPVPDLELTRILGNLLDNALSDASTAPLRRISLTVERKSNQNILIVISHLTDADIDVSAILKPDPAENTLRRELRQAFRLVEKNRSLSLSLSSYGNEFTVYLEMGEAPAAQM